MRLVQRNLTTVYYAKPIGTTRVQNADGRYTGQTTIQYGEPEEALMNVAPAMNVASLEPYGIHEAYTHILITDVDADWDTSTVFWIGADPETDPHNYICVRVARQLPTSGAIRLFVREVTIS